MSVSHFSTHVADLVAVPLELGQVDLMEPLLPGIPES